MLGLRRKGSFLIGWRGGPKCYSLSARRRLFDELLPLFLKDWSFTGFGHLLMMMMSGLQ